MVHRDRVVDSHESIELRQRPRDQQKFAVVEPEVRVAVDDVVVVWVAAGPGRSDTLVRVQLLPRSVDYAVAPHARQPRPTQLCVDAEVLPPLERTEPRHTPRGLARPDLDRVAVKDQFMQMVCDWSRLRW